MADVSEMTKSAANTVQHNPTGLAAAGAALVALPFAAQGVAKLVGKARKVDPGDTKLGELGEKATGKVTDKAKEIAGDAAGEKLKPKGLGSLFGGVLGSDDSDDDDDDDSGEGDATGSGRRMPIQQSIDVAAPLQATYNQWTQFEDWPTYMHRVDSVQQDDDCTVTMSTKVWGISKQFEAEIVEQRPDERIEWDVGQGLAHTGVVTFHELAPRLTRLEVTLDVQPDSLLEKMGRGMRFTKRAVRGDLHRFKAHAEMQEEDEGGWRGTIEDGEVKKKTERKSPSRSRSKRGSSGRGRNGSNPASSSRKSGSRS
ncbi:MAG TPA: SRPBCC family protein [Solirubrobacterales bacterium]|nr:SRPBCC family protein [Solirubrobacterales bacterium]